MQRRMTLPTQLIASLEACRNAARREVFLSEMDKGVPWVALCAVIDPIGPKSRAALRADNRSGCDTVMLSLISGRIGSKILMPMPLRVSPLGSTSIWK